METGPLMDLERAIWNRLPLRPPPEQLESQTSYLTRLAEANGFQSINEVGALAGGTNFSKRPDYPATAYSGLAQITGIPEAKWLERTFFYLVQHFGCPMNPHALHHFLAASLAPSLRYCPLCLAEHTPPYFSLLWRILQLPGCLEHGVYLLHQCGHCQSPLSLFTRPPQQTLCPTCQGDLRICKPSPLSNNDRESTVIRTNDLQMLLTPSPREHSPEQAKLIGRRFQVLRQGRDLWTSEVASFLDRDHSVIRAIDYANGERQAHLDDYIQYADVLGYSLCEIFDEGALQDLIVPFSEEQVLDQVIRAIRQLEARGKPIRPGPIADLIGTTARRLQQYPRVKKLLKRCETNQQRVIFLLDPRLEDELVKRLEQTLQQLEQNGEPVVLKHVCDLVGLTYSAMIRKHPRVRMLFHEYQKNRVSRYHSPPVNEDTKVQQVQAAINLLVSQGEAVTFMRIRQIAKLTQGQLRRSPRVKALLAQYIKRWQEKVS